MQQNTGNQNQGNQEPMSQVEMDQAIQDCIACSDACLQSATSNQQSGDFLRDCSELCLAAAHFMQHQNPLYGYVVSTAAEVTQRTGERCEQTGDTNVANACKNASWSLQQIAKMVAY
jgi:hypothetical protein